MNALRQPLTWQIVFVALFSFSLLTTQPELMAVLPFIVVIALGYLAVRIIWMMAQKPSVETASTNRLAPAMPAIDGEIDVASQDTGVDPDEFRTFLTSRVIGQDLVADQLARGIWRRAAQATRGKPVMTALLSGPTGTGKTEMAKSVADYLFGGPKSMLRIDCANVIGEAGLQTLIGAPKGYAGSDRWGALTSHLRASPNTVILFDELEKAVPNPNAPMAKLLLSLLDEGICTEQSDGTKVSASGAIIMMTSNAAHEQLGRLYEQYQDQPNELVRATKDALRDYFAPEFLARIDLVTTFAPLSLEARSNIVAMQLARIARSYEVEVKTVGASFINEALHRWANLEGYGTREIIRWVEDVTADGFIAKKREGLKRLRVSWDDGAVVIEADE